MQRYKNDFSVSGLYELTASFNKRVVDSSMYPEKYVHATLLKYTK